MIHERTLGDVRREIERKRMELREAHSTLSSDAEKVHRTEALIRLKEAQMLALATEEAEFERRARSHMTDTIPPDYQAPVYDPKRELAQ